MAGGDGILQTVVDASSASAFHVPGDILLLAPRAEEEEEEDAMGGRLGWSACRTAPARLILPMMRTQCARWMPSALPSSSTATQRSRMKLVPAVGRWGAPARRRWSWSGSARMGKRERGATMGGLARAREATGITLRRGWYRARPATFVPLLWLRALFVGNARVETRSWRAGAGGGTWAGSRVTASLPPLNTRPSIHGSSDTNFAGPPRLGRVEGGRAGEDDEGRGEAADDVRLRGAGCSMSGEDTASSVTRSCYSRSTQWRAGPAPPTPVLKELGTPLSSLRRPMRTLGSGAGSRWRRRCAWKTVRRSTSPRPYSSLHFLSAPRSFASSSRRYGSAEEHEEVGRGWLPYERGRWLYLTGTSHTPHSPRRPRWRRGGGARRR
ncbi:hypothetical protein DFH09DRAFT_172422 [Mycena vulgaris]|nr:hypothetical protein DFH09DRAFT_172422 [Mycena vulgaris]